MTYRATDATWQDFCKAELEILQPLLARLGFALDEQQIHLGGERSVISGKKLVLLGYRISDHKPIVIKASTHPDGRKEMEQRHAARVLLDDIKFAYNVFLSPEELVWHDENGCLVSITAFIDQPITFLERPLKEQFFLAMKAFETQESAHATTYEHQKMIRGSFRVYTSDTYLSMLEAYRETILSHFQQRTDLQALLDHVFDTLCSQKSRIEQYCGFLTHTDFVPHNIRVINRDIYLLDHYAIRFANKYEGWARFLNFMLLYHRELEQALLMYVKENRAPEEYETLHLMRLFRLTELVAYYVKRLEKTGGNLHLLDEARVEFWIDALQAQVEHRLLPQTRITEYQQLRDNLRSNEEKRRQERLH